MLKVNIPIAQRVDTDTGEIDAAWLAARIGKLTASRMREAMSYLKNGKESAERVKLKKQIVAERLCDSKASNYVNRAMEDGLAREPYALEAAIKYCGLNVIDSRHTFYDHPTIEFFGASPDGLVGADELLEIKCPTRDTHFDWLREKVVPEEHKPQMIVQLMCTQRRRVHFFAYCPEFKDVRLTYMHMIYEPTREEIEKVEAEAIKFLAEVDELFELVTA